MLPAGATWRKARELDSISYDLIGVTARCLFSQSPVLAHQATKENKMDGQNNAKDVKMVEHLRSTKRQ
jgi:hypothetical protein